MTGAASKPTVIIRKPLSWRAAASAALAWIPATTPCRSHPATIVARALWKGSPC